MRETATAITAVKEASQEGLNTAFGIPGSQCKPICAGFIVGTLFISGCAKSLEERSVPIDHLSGPKRSCYALPASEPLCHSEGRGRTEKEL